ncbi:MAG: MarR family winged helix-turn-helix transcriptional regulator [Oscillospiraceae bacterium]
MSEIRNTVTRQLQQLQTLMHRMVYHGFTVNGKTVHSPYRGQGRVLSVLRVKPEISQKELCGLLDMSKQSLAELLSKLEKNGYIAREPSPEDRRSCTVRLLPAGEKAAADMGGTPSGVDTIFDCLDDGELEQFSGYLSRIIRRCAESFPGEDLEERSRRMEAFLARYDHSFARFDESREEPALPAGRDGYRGAKSKH